MSSALQSTATTATNTPVPAVGMSAADSVAVPPETPSEHTVVSGSASIAHSHTDVEKQPIAPPQMPTFPEGSLRGWLTVAGAWLVIFSTFGMANTFGVFQSYYQFEGYPNETASTISWVGSVQLFFQFALGAVSGPLYDRGYFYYLFAAGSVIYIISLFMLSLTHAFWQVFLAQALGIGIGSGLLFLPAMSIVSQYFFKRRALAIGIVTTGSSIGGICLPIMLNNLIQSHGYRLAVQYTGYLILGCLVMAGALMRTRVDSPGMKGPKPSVGSLFQSKAYCFLIGGTFAVAWGLFFPLFYIQVFAESKGIDKNLVFYSLAILNAASVFGRLSPNFLADLFGSLNLITIMCAGAGVIAFAVFGAGTNGGLIAIAIFYGFFSGGYVSLISPSVISLAKSHNEIGLRLGMCFLITSLAALTGTPITGALLDRFGFYAPITWSGVFILVGSALFACAAQITKREKGTWKV